MTGARVLLVEDDAFTGKMMELQFRKHGFEIVLAINGDDALERCASADFEIILTDVLMPGMTGLELLSKLREQPRWQAVPVILLTALGDAKSILDGLERGADDFLAKTNEFGIILAKVNHHLEVSRLRQGTGAPALTRSPGDGTWIWSIPTGDIQYSSHYHAILGLEKKALGTKPEAWLARVHPEDRPEVEAQLSAHLGRSKAHFEADFRMLHETQGWIWVHAFGLASFAKEGQPIRLLGSLSALSARPTPTAVRQSLNQLRQLLSRVQAAPEVNTALQGLLEQLAQDLKL